MAAIEAVLFDLGRVLVAIDLSRGLFARLAATTDQTPDAVVAQLRRHGLFVRYCRGELTPPAFHEAVCDETGLDLAYDEFVRLWCEPFSLMPGMEDLMREVAARMPVGILSDTDPLHWEHLRARFPFLAELARPTLSYELGQMKPAPEVYRIAARRLGAAPGACFFTDDLAANVDGARAVGMAAEVFRSADELRSQLHARSVL